MSFHTFSAFMEEDRRADRPTFKPINVRPSVPRPTSPSNTPKPTTYKPLGSSINIGSSSMPIATISGCTDPKATNYNKYANLKDGSCQYDSSNKDDLQSQLDALGLGYIPTNNAVTVISTNDWNPNVSWSENLADELGVEFSPLLFPESNEKEVDYISKEEVLPPPQIIKTEPEVTYVESKDGNNNLYVTIGLSLVGLIIIYKTLKK